MEEPTSSNPGSQINFPPATPQGNQETEPLLSSLTPEIRSSVHVAVESYEQNIRSDKARRDPYPELLFFPSNDIQIVEANRVSDSAEPAITADIISASRGTTAEAMIDLLTKSYRVVRRNYDENGGKNSLPTARDPESIPDVDWPHNEFEPAQPIFLNIDILRQYNRDDNLRDRSMRQQNRYSVFHHFPFKRSTNESPVDHRAYMDPYKWSVKTTRLLVHCEKLQLAAGTFEPFFCSATLYDITKKVRVSESWHFDVNAPDVMTLLGSKVVKNPITSARRAVFDVVAPSPDIYLLVRVEKLLKGIELDQSIEPYTKDQLKQKEKEKLLKDLAQSASRLGEYTQPFAWGSLQLFNEAGQLLVGDMTQIKIQRAKMDDSEAFILDTLKKRHGKDKKITAIPSDFLFNFKIVPSDQIMEDLVNPSLLSVYKPTIGDQVVRQMQVFYEESDLLQPQFEFLNTLYIYPENLNFTKHKDTNSRNITVKIRIKDSDADPQGDGIPVVYGKSSTTTMKTQALTPVIYHKKTPAFMDEVKVNLPVRLSPTHHIMFLFSHVFCQAKGKSSVIELPLGFAAIPLFVDQKIIEDQRITVPVAASIAPQYLSPDAESNIKWVDNKKPLFTFRTKLISTIYTQDDNLNEFFKQYFSASESKQLTMALKKLKAVEEKFYAQFGSVVINMLISILCSRSDQVCREAIIALVGVIEKIGKLPNQGSRPPLLQFYIEYQFDNMKNLERTPYYSLIKFYDAILESKVEQVASFHEHSWFFFDLIVKSMTLHLAEEGALNVDEKRVNFFDKECCNTLKSLVRRLTNNVIESTGSLAGLSRYISLFLKDLLGLMNRGFVLQLIGNFISRLDPRNQIRVVVSCKFAALKVICCYEHFVPLNIPIIEEFSSVTTIVSDFWHRHYLVGLLLDETASCLSSNDISTRIKAITTLRDIMWKLDESVPVNEWEKKSRIASMFFPFILIALERYEIVAKADISEKREWGICVMFVLKYCDRDKLLRRWWQSDTLKHHRDFLYLLALIVKSIDSANLLKELSLVVLDTLEEFMLDMEEELLQPESQLMQYVFDVLVQLLDQKQTVSFLSCLFLSIRRFILKFKESIFLYRNTTYCSDLCFHILRYTNSANPITRSESASLLYLMIKVNYQVRNNFARTKLQSTIAVSRLCGESNVKDFTNLEKALTNVSRLAKKEFEQKFNNVAMGKDVEDLISRLFKIIRDSMKISEYSFDPEMIADLTYAVSIGYKDSPDLRVAWLGNLLRCHTDHQNYEEAAQCKFLIIALVIESLNSGGAILSGIPKDKNELAFISPNIIREPGLPTGDTQDEGLYNSTIFSEQGLIHGFNEAAKLLENCKRYETSIDMYDILLEIYQTRKDYANLARSFAELKTVSELLVNTDKTTGRLFNNYYRVTFFGDQFLELNGRELIYKQDAMIRLVDFSERLKSQYAKFGSVTILPNGPVDKAKLNPLGVYLQVIAVEPYFDEAEILNRKTDWDRNFNVSKFIYESPFTTTGESHGDISVQCKKKTILSTEYSFPYVKKRLLVKSKMEIILSPIETAIENVQMKENALRGELNKTPPNPKTLQIQLQGAVLTQVNAGVIEIANTFLGPKAVNYDLNQVITLCKCLKEFARVCGFAVKINNQLIQSDQITFQKECELGAMNLKNQITEICANTPIDQSLI